MGVSLGNSDKKAVNVELNIVPFVDIMSCLTIFLLAAATWVSVAQLNTRPTGLSRDANPCDGNPECDAPKLSVLLDADEIWVGVSRVNDFTKIPKTATGYDWAKLEDTLKQQKASSFFVNTSSIEIAADSSAAHPITYQSMIAAMDIAVKTGFGQVGITEPRGLSAYPTL